MSTPPSLPAPSAPPLERQRLAFMLGAPGIPLQGPTGASAHVRGLCAALAREQELRLYVARLTDHRGRHGEVLPAIECGLPWWPDVLGRWRELNEIRAARRIAARLLQDAEEGWVPELIIERHSLYSDAGWRAASALGCRWALEVNAPPVRERAAYEVLADRARAERWQQQVLLAAPVVVAVSRWLVKWLREEVGCRNVAWVPNGVVVCAGDPARGRKLLDLAEGERVIGFVGSMKEWHGLGRLERIARAAGARLALIGPVAEAPQGVICPGHLGPQSLADVVAALDVGLAPYPPDAPPWFCPLKILDYRAQGTPVVASDLGDVRALVDRGGSVVPAGDDDAFVEAVRGWIGRRVRPAVRSWEQVAAELLAAVAEPAQAAAS